jgi:hypothetical protein
VILLYETITLVLERMDARDLDDFGCDRCEGYILVLLGPCCKTGPNDLFVLRLFASHALIYESHFLPMLYIDG